MEVQTRVLQLSDLAVDLNLVLLSKLQEEVPHSQSLFALDVLEVAELIVDHFEQLTEVLQELVIHFVEHVEAGEVVAEQNQNVEEGLNFVRKLGLPSDVLVEVVDLEIFLQNQLSLHSELHQVVLIGGFEGLFRALFQHVELIN